MSSHTTRRPSSSAGLASGGIPGSPGVPDRAVLATVGRAAGLLLRSYRRARGWTISDLRKRMATVLSPKTLVTYETGTRTLSVERFVEQCYALGLEPGAVLTEALGQCTGTEIADAAWIWVDLAALARMKSGPQLRPLRRWAAAVIRDLPAGRRAEVVLTAPALRLLTELCGVDQAALRRSLLAVSRSRTRIFRG